MLLLEFDMFFQACKHDKKLMHVSKTIVALHDVIQIVSLSQETFHLSVSFRENRSYASDMLLSLLQHKTQK